MPATSPNGKRIWGDVLAPSLPGDFNHDGRVDAADYTVWRDTLGMTVAYGSGADANVNGLVDNGDFDMWRLRFGAVGKGIGASAELANVPEPSTLFLAVIAVIGCLVRCRRPFLLSSPASCKWLCLAGLAAGPATKPMAARCPPNAIKSSIAMLKQPLPSQPRNPIQVTFRIRVHRDSSIRSAKAVAERRRPRKINATRSVHRDDRRHGLVEGLARIHRPGRRANRSAQLPSRRSVSFPCHPCNCRQSHEATSSTTMFRRFARPGRATVAELVTSSAFTSHFPFAGFGIDPHKQFAGVFQSLEHDIAATSPITKPLRSMSNSSRPASDRHRPPRRAHVPDQPPKTMNRLRAAASADHTGHPRLLGPPADSNQRSRRRSCSFVDQPRS